MEIEFYFPIKKIFRTRHLILHCQNKMFFHLRKKKEKFKYYIKAKKKVKKKLILFNVKKRIILK